MAKNNVTEDVWLSLCYFRFKTMCHATMVARVQELCESRGGCPGLPVLMSFTVSVDAKQH